MQPFVIPLNGQAAAESAFEWHVGGEFFESFGNSEVLDADLRVNARMVRSGSFIGVECAVQGSITVQCDRCLDDLNLPVDTSFALSIKFGEREEYSEADGREIVMLPYGDAQLDLSQFIYDYALTALPMQRVHPEGECNGDMTKYLINDNFKID